jgi:pilus assembly protein FimV
VDFDLGGGQAAPTTPDISLDEPAKETPAAPVLDFDIGGTTQAIAPAAKDVSHDETVMGVDTKGQAAPTSIDFNLDLGGGAAKAAPAAEPEPASGGLEFDLNLDLGGGTKPAEPAAPATDLSALSLDLGTGEETVAIRSASTDPKWQEVATKLDLAKAYEEMGDKDGARELLNEVMKDGDAAQKGQAQQLLAKLG